MNLQNGYKVIYEKAADGKRTFYASKTGVFADAEQIGDVIEIGKYKLIYEKAGRFYGSETGIPADDDYCFEAFDKVFVSGNAEKTDEVEEPVAPVAQSEEEPEVTEPEVTEPENSEEPEVEPENKDQE